MVCCARFIGLMRMSVKKWFKGDLDHDYVDKMIDQRLNAKLEKNWKLADQIRDDLAKIGVIIEDKSNGVTVWRKIKQKK